MKDTLIELKTTSIYFLKELGLSDTWAVFVQSVVAVLLVLTLALLVHKISTILMRHFLPKIISRTKTNWDDILLKNKVFSKLSRFLIGGVVLMFYDFIASDAIRFFIELVIESYFIIIFLLFLNAIINSFRDIYGDIKGESADIKIYLQLLKVALFSLGAIAIISIFANKNFIDILKGLGAMITVLLIVYKDTILGFVAGIQLSANNMLKVGDWVSLPKHNADGVVTDITLTAVKVQNWDKTITTMPTYRLISESFTNWKGMEESGGRRIKRHLNIDMESVCFLDESEINRLKNIKLLQDYIEEKTEEVRAENRTESNPLNQRKLTNLGTFRKYIENFLKSTGYANMEMTFIVRQLQPTELGIPIEIYMFCKEKRWAVYEQIQADIFDHIIAIVPEFNLQIFQRPSGRSFKNG